MGVNPPKRLWFVLPMGSMRATQPRRALSTGMRLVTLGTALACAFTLMSPPMRRHRWRLRASPRPVPPYLRVVPVSACVNS